jgi:3-hydroxyisobutyrate dehydrogenase
MPSSTSAPRIAFLGLGIMGSRMARRLLDAGFPLAVFNRSAEPARALGADGATVARTPAEAARDADIVMSMVADDDASRSVWDGPDGALAGARDGSVLVESSTVTVGRIREFAESAERAGCRVVDAPVAGSKVQAGAGELVYFVGAADDDLARVRPALEVTGKSVLHCGPVGSGALVKLVNNFLAGVQAASLAEGLAVIERAGLDSVRILGALSNGAPGSPMVKTLAGRILAQDYTPNFYLHLLAKDMGYAMTEGERHDVPMTMAAAALDVLRGGIAHGDGDRDMAAVVEQFRRGAAAR